MSRTTPIPQGDPLTLPRVFGRYLLLDRISRGGMGEIFLARHGLKGFEKIVVIKKIRAGLGEDPGFAARFSDEAQLTVTLQHANIAQVYEVGQRGVEFFLSLEYIEGRDLRKTLHKLETVGGRLPRDLALFVAREVLSGLAHAHRKADRNGDLLDIVHCDISPPNVMISFEGEIKIIDFGIARSALKASGSDPKMGWGKFGYMSPEQLIAGQEIDHRTDIYAVGVLLFEMLTGRRMHPPGDPPDYKVLARKVNKGEHPLPSEVDPDLAVFDDMISRALKPKREDRYQTAAEFRDAVQRALVQVNPTISGDAVGLFMRHLFADERIEWRQRLDALLEQSDDAMWRKKLEAPEPTITFAIGERFVGDDDPLVVRESETTEVPTSGQRLPRRFLLLASAAVLAMTAAGVITVRAARRPPAVPPPPPEPVVVELPSRDLEESDPDAGVGAESSDPGHEPVIRGN